jgi:signal transduction histidine kinase
MEPVRRVVIRDRHPIFGPELLHRRLNRWVLLAAALSIGIQAAALAQVLAGHGRSVAWPDHVAIAAVALLWLAMGVLVFLQRRAHRAGQLFLLSASAGAAFLSLATLYGTGLANAVLFVTGLMLCAAFLVSFSRAYSESRTWDARELLIYLPALVLVLPGAQDLVAGRTTIWWKLCLVVVAGYLIAAIVQSALDLRMAAAPTAAAQSRALLVGLVAGTAPGIALFVWPIISSGSVLVSTGILPWIILLFLVAISYAVLLFEFSEADLIVRRGVIYALITLVMLGAYGVLGALLEVSRSSVIGVAGGIGFVAASIAIGVVFLPLQRTGRVFVDWLFYGPSADRWQTLQSLSARLGTIMQPDDLGRALVSELGHALHLRGAFLFRRDANGSFRLWCHYDRSPEGGPSEPADAFVLSTDAVTSALGTPPVPLLLVHAKPLTLGRRETIPAALRTLDEIRACLTVPLVTRSGLEAVLCLQAKLAHDAFRTEDLELLAPIVQQAAIALDNALLFARLEDTIGELRHAYMRIAQEQETERARLARELHDGTAQELAALMTLAAVAGRQLEAGADSRDAARATLDRLRLRAEEAYQGVRRASHALRPAMLDDFGLAAALSRYTEEYQEATGIEVLRSVDEVGAIGSDVELALFRVAQECLENVRKHSGSPTARLTLSRSDGQVILSVRDSGPGGQPARALSSSQNGDAGSGLAGMRERVQAVGGKLILTDLAGFEVRAVVPVSRDDAQGARQEGSRK